MTKATSTKTKQSMMLFLIIIVPLEMFAVVDIIPVFSFKASLTPYVFAIPVTVTVSHLFYHDQINVENIHYCSSSSSEILWYIS